MKKIGVLFFAFLFSQSLFAQHKIVLTKGLHRIVIHTGKQIRFNEAIDNFPQLSLTPDNSRNSHQSWFIDSIQPKYLILKDIDKTNSSFRLDTISSNDLKRITSFAKIGGVLQRFFYVQQNSSLKKSKSKLFYVYKNPTKLIYKRINIEDIASLTFAKADEYKHSPNDPKLGKWGKDGGYGACFEVIGLGIIFAIEKTVIENDNKIKIYDLYEWKMKVK